jgi:hypothetical protein
MERECSGWFFNFRGNWYGPYSDYEKSVEKYYKKHLKFPDSICYPIYAWVKVSTDKKLIDIKRDYKKEIQAKLTLPRIHLKIENELLINKV